MTRYGKRLTVATITLAAALAPVTAASSASSASSVASGPVAVSPPVRSLDRIAHPLRSVEPGTGGADLRALGAMIGDAEVVGVGEATHGSHEFFALRHRIFRHLVERKGFTTFALEMSWSAGLRIDDYLQRGDGDARQVVHQAMAGSPWDREEFVSLVRWMRDHNRRHPDRPVRFLGDDIGAPRLDKRVFDNVTGHVRRAHPQLLPRLDEALGGLRPLDDAIAYLKRPVAERRQNAARAQRMLDLLERQGRPGRGPGDDGHDFALQNARHIAQTYTFLAFDPQDQDSLTAMQLYRDRVMAETTAWWRRHTRGKVLVSAHNDHVGYAASDPATYPRTQGRFLRDILGARYLAVGTTFDHGSFLSKDQALGGRWRRFTVGPAAPGSNEHVLDQVRYRDYYADLRRAPAAARTWLDTPRPSYSIGTLFPTGRTTEIAVGRSYDVLVHLHAVREATQL
ncbi:hypothetical protein GCM10009678_01970 [Actinomadura kijaniata]|uniref:Erythromycin esterase n=1 Tax=Actinomadura namibiensis TaxID=182080 RepID=A0A7W3QNQ5_ACTNM|nr:erythromycin esterase family protein [Actinomadura namibiensis]MBA8953278.1 erythromycin esterase [Actinomadura namibiensis]